MNIKNIEIPHGLCLAPLAGVSDRAFRKICRAHGAEYLCSEMVSAAAICYGDKKTPRLCAFDEDEMPMAIQLFGARPAFFAEAAKRIAEGTLEAGLRIPAAIDINMGCPVRKIVSCGEGSALMRDPQLAADIVRAVKEAVDIPVTVKIRAGFDENSVNAPEFAARLEDAGADMICVHGRTRAQMYSGRADLSVIAAVKARVRVPVCGNGDIFSAADALRMFRETGCDGVMVARGAMGNPWIFEEISAALSGRLFTPPKKDEIVAEALRHLSLMLETKPQAIAIPEARKHMAQYIRNFRGAAAARGRLNTCEREAEMRQVLLELASENSEATPEN